MKFSIIIPVYNAEIFLQECIDSILMQTITDFELLLINDGSTDNSGSICDSFALKDKRIKVFHQENNGVSASRNLGLAKAKGEWITFVDSDDYVGVDYFKNISDENDFILCNVKRIKDSKCINHIDFENSKYNLGEFFNKFNLYPYFPGPWAKFFKRDIIIDNKIKFNIKLSFGEDALFNITYLNFVKKICTTNHSNYYYRDTSNGLSYKKFDYDHDLLFFNEMDEKLKSFNNENILKTNIKYPALRYFFAIINSSFTINEKTEKIEALREKYKTVLVNFLKNDKILGISLSFFIKYKLIKLIIILRKIRNI